MTEILITYAAEILSALFITLIGVLGAWLTAKLAKREELANINHAQQEAIRHAQLTVEELQQTVVIGMKAAHEDGKLTKDEIAELGQLLLDKTLAKMSTPAINVLAAASVDIQGLIRGAGEAWINTNKNW